MKSLGVVALALLCLGLFAFAVRNVLTTAREWEFAQDTARLFTAIEVERIVRDSTDKVVARLDSITRAGLVVAGRNNRERGRLLGERDSLAVALSQSQSAPESLLTARRTNEVLDSALGVASQEIEALESVIGGQAQMLSVAKLENDRLWTLIDSASSVIRRVPKTCRVPLIGVRCPVPVVGVGFTPQPRAFVGVGIPLR